MRTEIIAVQLSHESKASKFSLQFSFKEKNKRRSLHFLVFLFKSIEVFLKQNKDYSFLKEKKFFAVFFNKKVKYRSFPFNKMKIIAVSSHTKVKHRNFLSQSKYYLQISSKVGKDMIVAVI